MAASNRTGPQAVPCGSGCIECQPPLPLPPFFLLPLQYRPGCVGFVSKSGGMSNECYSVIARAADGVYEGEGEGRGRRGSPPFPFPVYVFVVLWCLG